MNENTKNMNVAVEDESIDVYVEQWEKDTWIFENC